MHSPSLVRLHQALEEELFEAPATVYERDDLAHDLILDLCSRFPHELGVRTHCLLELGRELPAVRSRS